jgi:hypothetical protein
MRLPWESAIGNRGHIKAVPITQTSTGAGKRHDYEMTAWQ